MAQKKAYSRYFIILQQDENGYSLSSDKLPSGYTKLETKNDKCKVSYYVQNLKKALEPYYMVLICSKKDMKKLIKLGVMNIDDHGRAEVTYEYSTSNLGGSGVSIDMVTGSAVVKMEDSKMISVMSGFATADTPAEWKSFEAFETQRSSTEVKKALEEEKVVQEEKFVQEEKVVGEVIEVPEVQKESSVVIEKPNTIFDEYEEKIEEEKREHLEVEADKQQTEVKMSAEEPTLNTFEETQVNQQQEVKFAQQAENVLREEYDEVRKHEEKVVEEKKLVDEEYPIGTVGEFFKIVAEDFNEVKDTCAEIRRCRWYKVNVNSLEDMCNASNYNKYTIVYYPMMSYYPYIRKHGHYLLGYKYDTSGKMKYIVYGIPGTRDLNDQPFGGKSGFVTWVSEKEGEERDGDFGYWLMFYDFRTSTIVIPVK